MQGCSQSTSRARREIHGPGNTAVYCSSAIRLLLEKRVTGKQAYQVLQLNLDMITGTSSIGHEAASMGTDSIGHG